MKKLIVGCICVAAFASCNIKNSDEYKALQAERDSLALLNAESQGEVTGFMDVIDNIEENFRQIRETEKYLTLESQKKGEMSNDTKTRIKDNFEMVNEILQKNKDQINKLEKQLKGNSGENSALKKTLAMLKTELEEKTATIADLQTKLAERDEMIAGLTNVNQALSQNVESLSTTATTQASKIKEQDKELNTAYYMFGTSKELKEAKVVSGGLLASSKILKESIEKSKFIKIDIRTTLNIPVYSKKAKILSDHPSDSYLFDKDSKGQIVIKIIDYSRFWSLTRYLVVEVG